MLIVINNEGKKIKTSDIETGIVPSNDYICISCGLKMIYVKESERSISYFRHFDKSCLEKYNYSKNDLENEYNNDMSIFHKNWQFIFPNNNLEYKIKENDKLHIADIFINSLENNIQLYDENKKKIFKNKNIKNLVIEIQNSKINDNILNERENFYRNENKNRELLWIFNLRNECKIEKIITFDDVFYRIKLNSNKHDFIKLFKNNNESNIILDNNQQYLYIIRNKPNLDNDYIEVSKIKRSSFLNQLNKYIKNEEIKWKGEINKTELSLYDYETFLNTKKNIISQENIDKIRYLFYILEKIPILNYFDEHSVNDIFSIFYYYSNKDQEVINKFNKILKRYKQTFETIIHFGKYKNYYLYEIDYNYLKWLNENSNNEYCRCKNNKKCDNCNLYDNVETILKYNLDNHLQLFKNFYNIDEYKRETNNIKNYNEWLNEKINSNYKYIMNEISDYIIFNYENVLLDIPDKNKLSDINNYNYIDNYEKKIYLKKKLQKLKFDCKISCYFCNEYKYPLYIGGKHYNICYDCNSKNINELNNMKNNKNNFDDCFDNCIDDCIKKNLDDISEIEDGIASICIHCDYYVWENNNGEFRENGVIHNNKEILLHKKCKESWLNGYSSQIIKKQINRMNNEKKDKWFLDKI